MNNVRSDIFGLPMDTIDNCHYFVVSLKKLSDFHDTNNVVVWDHQRSLDNTRARTIAQAFDAEYKNSGKINLRGSILLCKKPSDLLFPNDIYYIIDGQHRFFALKHLVNRIPNFRIRVDILYLNSEAEIEKEFRNINKSVPVPLNILEPNDVVNTCFVELQKIYKKGFKNGKCNRPCINIDDFKDEILKNNIIEEFNIKSGSELSKLIRSVNHLFGQYSNEDLFMLYDVKNNQKDKDFILRNIAKCKSGDYLFMGLYKRNVSGMWINFIKRDDIKNWLLVNMKTPEIKI